MKKIILTALILITSFILVGCKKEVPNVNNTECNNIFELSQEFKDSSSSMLYCDFNWTSDYFDTIINLRIFINPQVDSQDIEKNVEEIIEYYHQISDKYNPYDNVTNIYTLNQNPTDTHTVDKELINIIELSLYHEKNTSDLFSISLGPVLEIWHDYREACIPDPFEYNSWSGTCEKPTQDELNVTIPYMDSDNITIDEANNTITMTENMKLDLGAVSKGYMSQKLKDYLDSLDISGYLLNAGTSIILAGGQYGLRDSGIFNVVATDPTYSLKIGSPNTNKSWYAWLEITDGDVIVTSGDYDRFYMAGDEYLHHIIDPNTLQPERNLRAVTLVTNNAALGDIYSTAIFLMTVEDGIEFVNSIPNLEAIWYGMDGTISYSENLESEYLRTLNE